MKKVLIVFTLSLVTLSGCSGPKDAVIPSDPQKWAQLENSTKGLSDGDRKEFSAYMTRMIFGGAMTGSGPSIPAGTTVGQAIADQKQFEAQQAEQEAQQASVKAKIDAERRAQIDAINKIATVAVAQIAIIPKDIEQGRFSSRLDLTIAIQNRGSKTITGVKGIIDFKDQFGAEISSLNASLTKDVAPGATVAISDYGRDLNEFDQSDNTLATTPFDRMHISFTPAMIVFADGSTMQAPSPDSPAS